MPQGRHNIQPPELKGKDGGVKLVSRGGTSRRQFVLAIAMTRWKWTASFCPRTNLIY
ncbi:hypothetical protein PanWU01x14_318790 [Parasponia andersonii]|uniref:Uncharacterized protein n=1 Tax=Parasponia andersonii TaxID=3476 RepID=A0A2P5AM81_PARAD|nr:hypothetical protein PanWU01x14_318790 [Parasponia andersonii]